MIALSQAHGDTGPIGDVPESYAPDDPRALRRFFGIREDDWEMLK